MKFQAAGGYARRVGGSAQPVALRMRAGTLGSGKRISDAGDVHAISGRMSIPITVSIPHQLGRTGARRRIETGLTQILQSLPGAAATSSQRWEADRLHFSVSSMGQTVSGIIDVLDATVNMEIQLPGMLGMIASGMKDRVRKVGQLLLTKE